MGVVQVMKVEKSSSTGLAVFTLGFRPFFLAASGVSIVSVALWLGVFARGLQIPTGRISLFEWHAHQMIFGFGIAVVAGFLLTAIANWTGRQTLHGLPLAGLVAAWLVARIALFAGDRFILIAGIFDAFFTLGLLYAIAAPICAARQWHQLIILLQVVLLAACNACFYFDAAGWYASGAFVGSYGGLFILVGLILTIGSRVLVPFITSGVDEPVELSDPAWTVLPTASVFSVFVLNFLFWQRPALQGGCALLLFLLVTYRLYRWHTRHLWRKPLLWGLYCAYIFIDLAFLLFCLDHFIELPGLIALHAFAYGGVGMATLAMMARVSLGHTGRRILEPPPLIGIMLGVLLCGAVVRVILPVLQLVEYRWLIIAAQLLWLAAFTLYILLFGKMLCTARIDNRPG